MHQRTLPEGMELQGVAGKKGIKLGFFAPQEGESNPQNPPDPKQGLWVGVSISAVEYGLEQDVKAYFPMAVCRNKQQNQPWIAVEDPHQHNNRGYPLRLGNINVRPYRKSDTGEQRTLVALNMQDDQGMTPFSIDEALPPLTMPDRKIDTAAFLAKIGFPDVVQVTARTPQERQREHQEREACVELRSAIYDLYTDLYGREPELSDPVLDGQSQRLTSTGLHLTLKKLERQQARRMGEQKPFNPRPASLERTHVNASMDDPPWQHLSDRSHGTAQFAGLLAVDKQGQIVAGHGLHGAEGLAAGLPFDVDLVLYQQIAAHWHGSESIQQIGDEEEAAELIQPLVNTEPEQAAQALSKGSSGKPYHIIGITEEVLPPETLQEIEKATYALQPLSGYTLPEGIGLVSGTGCHEADGLMASVETRQALKDALQNHPPTDTEELEVTPR